MYNSVDTYSLTPLFFALLQDLVAATYKNLD